jgi:hypothetical protein
LFYGFDKPWVGVALVLWVLIVGAFHGLVVPSHRQLAAALGEGVAGDDERVKVLEQRAALGGALIDVMLIVSVYLMVFKPGQ